MTSASPTDGNSPILENLLGDDDWDQPLRRKNEDDILTISTESWEGPLDVLLALARTQKVDLREISILALVAQYLKFIDEARALRLELAADYLVMAAWLAYLKSALLLPKEEQPDPSPEELALRLHLRLQRLEAMREAGARLMARGPHRARRFSPAQSGRAAPSARLPLAGQPVRSHPGLWTSEGADGAPHSYRRAPRRHDARCGIGARLPVARGAARLVDTGEFPAHDRRPGIAPLRARQQLRCRP